MDTLSPELKQALMNLPSGFNDYKAESQRKFDVLESKIDEAVFVNMTNGEGKKAKIANIIPKMHKDLEDIKQSTEFLRDFQKLHNIMRKYKLYHFFTTVMLLILGLGAKDIVVEALKGFIK